MEIRRPRQFLLSALALAVAGIAAGIFVSCDTQAQTPSFIEVNETVVCVVPGHGSITIVVNQIAQGGGWVMGNVTLKRPDQQDQISLGTATWVNLSHCVYLEKLQAPAAAQ